MNMVEGAVTKIANRASGPAWYRRSGSWLIAAVLLAGFALRLHGIGFGLPALNDPDELMFELGAVRMLSGPTLNPGWFGHPATTTMYVLAVIDVAVFGTGYLAGWFTSAKSFANAIYADPGLVILPGRVVMALFAVAVIYLTYRLARTLFDRSTALVAAVLLAVNPVHIAWSQVIRSDMMACLFMLLCMLSAVRIARENQWRDHVLASLWLGLAIATKWPFALTGSAVAGAMLLRFIDYPQERRTAALRMVGFGAMSLCFLLLASPYIVLDQATLMSNLRGEAQLKHVGSSGGTTIENAWWYVSGPLLSGLGLAGLIVSGAGCILMARRRLAIAVIAPVALIFFILICPQNLVWERWVLPLFPLLSIAAAFALVFAARYLAGRLPRYLFRTIAVAALATLVLPLLLAADLQAQARINDTRQQASRWAKRMIPAGSTVLIEHFAFDLVPQPWNFVFPMGDLGCVDAKAMLQGKIRYSQIDQARNGRSNVDYGTLPPDRRGTCTADYAILTQYDRYADERADFPVEYQSYRQLLAQGAVVATFAPALGRAAGPTVRIVRFGK